MPGLPGRSPAARAVAAAAEPGEGAGGGVPLRPGCRPRLLGCPPSGPAVGWPVRGPAVLPAPVRDRRGAAAARRRFEPLSRPREARHLSAGLASVSPRPETDRVLKLLHFENMVESVPASGHCALIALVMCAVVGRLNTA